MTKGTKTYQWCIALLLCLVQTAGIAMYGQDRPRAAAKRQQKELADTLRKIPQIVPDSLDALSDPILQRVSTADSLAVADSIAAENKKRLLEITSAPTPQVPDTPADSLNKELNKKVFIPNPTKATWLALVIPGGGQIYNRKYWKLPIIYGGFAGCAYALTWNGKMYKDYMQAYKDASKGNWDASSITDLLPPGYIDRVSQTPTKATWLALVIPGGGQIYNRKYWKLPIIYGGFAGCAYALTWNGKMYKDYMQAYKDASKGNWDASSITDLLPPGYIDRVSQTQIVETLRKRKDTYRRYRDLSIFAFIGVYLISVIDAYVDAELSNFDITPDLSMRIEPAVINNPYSSGTSNKSVGLQCSFRF